MTWLSKRDKKFLYLSVLLSIVFSHYLCPFITLKIDYIVEFFSIIIGFLISAIALLHSSNIRIVLYNTKSEGYPNYWYKIISYYRVAIIYFLFLILVLVVKIDSIPDGLYQEIYLAVLIEGVYWVLKIVVSLFYLLTVEINSKWYMCKRNASGVPFNICMFYLVPLIKEIEKVIQKRKFLFQVSWFKQVSMHWGIWKIKNSLIIRNYWLFLEYNI